MNLDIGVDKFHDMAKSAVSEILKMSNPLGVHLNDYSEAQYVHFLGAQFLKKKLWGAFEYHYPEAASKKAHPQIADFVVASQCGPRKGGQHLWVEVKRTGLTHTAESQTSYSGWEEDFKKLTTILDDRHWNANHFGFWSWLHL